MEDRAHLGANESVARRDARPSRPIRACWAGLARAVASLCRDHDPCPVFVSSESSLVRKLHAPQALVDFIDDAVRA